VGQLQDLYLPTNTLAALANLAPQVSEAERFAQHQKTNAIIAGWGFTAGCSHTAATLLLSNPANSADMCTWRKHFDVLQHHIHAHVDAQKPHLAMLILPTPCALLPLQVSGLHSHAAQRLVGLTSLLARRWLKLSQAMPSGTPNQDIQVSRLGREAVQAVGHAGSLKFGVEQF
jgi:hypothetical protein